MFQIIIKRRSYIPPTFIEFMHGVKPRDGRWIRPQGTQVAKRSITSPLSFWRIKAMHMGQGWWTQHRWTWWNSGRGDGVQDSPALSASLPWGHRVGRDWATEQQSASPGTPLLLTPPGHRKTSLLKELWLSSFPSYSVGPCCVPGIALSPKDTAINKTAAVCLRWPE